MISWAGATRLLAVANLLRYGRLQAGAVRLQADDSAITDSVFSDSIKILIFFIAIPCRAP